MLALSYNIIGGRTVDMNTYTVASSIPLQLVQRGHQRRELCGSSFLNEDFHNLLYDLLKDEPFLKREGPAIPLTKALSEFENRVKQNFDYGGSNTRVVCLRVPGLCQNPKRGFVQGRVCIPVYVFTLRLISTH